MCVSVISVADGGAGSPILFSSGVETASSSFQIWMVPWCAHLHGLLEELEGGRHVRPEEERLVREPVEHLAVLAVLLLHPVREVLERTVEVVHLFGPVLSSGS